MNFKRFHESKNLAPPLSEWVDGYVNGNDGSISPASTINKEKTSGYISIESGKAYTFSREGSFPQGSDIAWRGIGLYDNNKNFISRVAYSSTNTLSVNAPSNAVYCRLSFRTYGETTETMFNHGSTALPYEPYSSEVWHDTSHYIHKTATDTITTLPAVLYPNDTTATVGLKGQTVQSTTPTPQNPVIPNGTGERTGNVMPAGEQKTVETNGVTFSSDGKGRYHISGTATASTSARFNLLSPFIAPISVSNGGQGTLSFFNTQTDNNVTFNFYNGSTKVDDWKQTPIRRTSITYNAISNKYVDGVVIKVNSGATVDITITPEFTNDGVLPSEFEPYGYKIPILSNSTTTPVYLGEVETTRSVKKLVLTGEEGWVRTSNQRCYYINASTGCPTNYLKRTITTSICSHYQSQNNTTSGSNEVEAGHFCFFTGGGFELYIGETTISSAADFKTYLQQQYAAGTPVTVWYVLAEPTTGIVNEPIRKIGDYADEVSGISIPTIAGANTIDVDTTLKPSEVTVNYHGWHPVQSVHEFTSNYTVETMQALTIAQLQTHTISELQGGEWS